MLTIPMQFSKKNTEKHDDETKRKSSPTAIVCLLNMRLKCYSFRRNVNFTFLTIMLRSIILQGSPSLMFSISWYAWSPCIYELKKKYWDVKVINTGVRQYNLVYFFLIKCKIVQRNKYTYLSRRFLMQSNIIDIMKS